MNAASRFAVAAALCWTGSLQAQQHDQHHEQGHQPPESADTTQRDAPTQSESEHVPPDPPSSELGHMTYRSMVDMMDMDDKAPIGKVLLDQLDWRDADGATAFAWDVQAYYGTDYDKLWLKTEGERASGTTADARLEVLWDRIVGRWWSTQAGVRHDFGEGPSREWLALGVQGLAPYFFELEATAYLGDAGRTAARLEADYELLFTQQLILTPQIELNLYGKDDPERRIMSGLSDAEISLRLRYEIRREIAPYIGVAWVHRFGRTADLFRAAGEDASDVEALAGIRIWF